jgi:crotonobetainyl-CoA:carnitine CoA-transferase CaiB-like acyl-CoA transferase
VSVTHIFGSAVGPATARLMRCVCDDGFCDEAMRDKDWVGYAELLASGAEPLEEFERAKAAVAAWTASRTKAELLELAMERGLLIAPISTPSEVLGSPQLEARTYFEARERPDGRGDVLVPGAWAKFSRTPLRRVRRAPRLGEHTDEILAELRQPRPAAAPEPPARSPGRPLEGVRILDFMWAIAGPMATRALADYGATVIRVESTSRVDTCRTIRPFVGGEPGADTAALFHGCNANKRMLTLDLAKPEAREVVLDLVRWADVVCESFSPGTMKKLGFDYDSLVERKPDLVMLSTCLMGQTGPIARFAGYGNLAAAISGFFDLAGWADRDPAGPYSAYTDYIAPKFVAAAILAALEHRRRTGEGQHVDLSQGEVALHFLAPALLALAANGEEWTRAGNRDEDRAPHGCYPVAGDDRWIAIAVEDDAEWRSLCDVLGDAELAADARFADAAGRRAHHEALDLALAERTAARSGGELESALVARGVPAHRVLDSPGLVEDPQLLFRDHFVEVAENGLRTVVEATRSRLSRTPGRVGDAIPSLGRDNEWVLNEVLRYDDEHIARLVIAGVLE